VDVQASYYQLERQLARSNPKTRRSHGVFYTPWQLAMAIVVRVDTVLKREFRLPLGLADGKSWRQVGIRPATESICIDQPIATIMEPSVGSGIFLAAVLRTMYRNLQAEYGSGKQLACRWQKLVETELPFRLVGIDLMPQAITEAKICLARELEQSGLSETHVESIPLIQCDALDHSIYQRVPNPTVIIGNPPYSSGSTNSGKWVCDLLRGKTANTVASLSYFEVDGKPLKEKKLWLHDDYVKFMRVAQWHIERSGVGVVGLVTNHGFLDNVTFRGMRFQLLDQFNQIELLNLHGSAKQRGTAAKRAGDASVFDIGQGVSATILARTPNRNPSSVRYGELLGPKSAKLDRLASKQWHELVSEEIQPASPNYLLVPQCTKMQARYESGIPILDLFPRSTSAMVTARDSIVIDTCRRRLLNRIADFRDTKLSDEQLRARYFPRARSQRYVPGDTRSWKLARAREILREDDNWQDRVELCAYRPFDYRWIYSPSWMIDWPRGEVMDAMRSGSAMALVVRRQMPPDRPCNFFFASRLPVVDGLIRSDNRGNETVIPLFVGKGINVRDERLPNYFNSPENDQASSPELLQAFVYGLFCSRTYQESFQTQLRLDFPRVFFPQTRHVFQGIAKLGAELLLLHSELPSTEVLNPTQTIGAGYPKWKSGAIWIDDKTPIAEVSEIAWNFQIGSHQVLRKWLKDRRQQGLARQEIEWFQSVCHRLERTLQCIAKIDALIERCGGLDLVFGLNNPQGYSSSRSFAKTV